MPSSDADERVQLTRAAKFKLDNIATRYELETLPRDDISWFKGILHQIDHIYAVVTNK